MATLDEILRHPAPELQIQLGSQLGDLEWVEYHTDPVHGSSSHTFGPDGVTVVMRMLVYWHRLGDAIQRLLGFSWRDPDNPTSRGTPRLRRQLPWQHPQFNQLFVKRISEVRGIRMVGKTYTTELVAYISGGKDRMGPATPPNTGPRSDYLLADLTLHFWRPPYYVRDDLAIVGSVAENPSRDPREWLRYVSKQWEVQLSMLSRENAQFQWLPGIKPPGSGQVFTGSVGQAVTHSRVSRTWYQIPEQAIFKSIGPSLMPEGIPRNLLYTQTAVENPLSKFDRALPRTETTYTTQQVTTTPSGSVTVTTNPSATRTTLGATQPNASQLLATFGYVYPYDSPLPGCVNAPISPTGGTGITAAAVDQLGNWIDLTTASRFFGCYTGTLRYDGVTIDPQPLQMPPELMLIPRLTVGWPEALSQQQYDVTFHFDLFEPPPGSSYGTPVRGHNLFPFAGNGQWYPLLSQKDINNSTAGAKLTPFHYADFTDLFYIL